MSMPPKREFDVIIYGATGYTGEQVARALGGMAASGGSWACARWAIAGRSKAKLEAMATKHGLKPTGVVVADVGDAGSLTAMCARAAILMNATGPYRFYGEPVVTACIAAKTDYVDLCGEPEFIDRCLLRHTEAAKAAGVIIVHACAFDSVPADIGTLFTALQMPPPALCAHADMYHTFSVDGPLEGAAAHATTFYAAVHGFGGAKETRAQRKELLAKLEAEAPGSSVGPVPLGPRLRVATGPTYKAELGQYAFLFPGSDVAVVRTSQRALARAPRKPGEPYLTPQFGASFCVAGAKWALATAVMGLLFNVLSARSWGRKLLLKHPKLFTLGAFTDEGPSEATLAASSWKTTFFGKGWAQASAEAPPKTGFDVLVRTSVSGPEPGYIATSLMFLAMARCVLEDRPLLGVSGGVFTPGALVGSGGSVGVNRLVERLRRVGIRFEVEEKRAITPKPGQGGSQAGGDDKAPQQQRPVWQTALNACALFGWLGVLSFLCWEWESVSGAWGSTLLSTTLALEAVCVFELAQIVLGTARGNVLLGAIVRGVRALSALVVLPAMPHALPTKIVLLAWSLTEVCRRPVMASDDL